MLATTTAKDVMTTDNSSGTLLGVGEDIAEQS